MRALAPDEVVGVEPALGGIRARLAGGIHSPGDAVGDPHLFCVALVERLRAEGLQTRFGVAVEAIERGPALRLAGGERVEARHLVVAAGPQAAALLRPLGWRVPIMPVRGHSVTLPPGSHAPSVSITDVAAKLVFCRLGERMRIAGLADVGFSEAEVDPKRLKAMVDAARESLPDAADYAEEGSAWAGLRPVTPDSLPIVERRGGVTVNVGHGGLGWTYALATARTGRGAGRLKRQAHVILGDRRLHGARAARHSRARPAACGVRTRRRRGSGASAWSGTS